jgi:hypothetical protein
MKIQHFFFKKKNQKLGLSELSLDIYLHCNEFADRNGYRTYIALP